MWESGEFDVIHYAAACWYAASHCEINICVHICKKVTDEVKSSLWRTACEYGKMLERSVGRKCGVEFFAEVNSIYLIQYSEYS